MILITGASGTIGSKVVRLLRQRGERIRAMTRDPERIGSGVEVVRADFAEPATLTAAVDGVRAVFLLNAPGSWIPEHDLALVRAAAAAGVRTVVKLSAIGADTDTGSWHRPGEIALLESGMSATILRPAGFASNALGWAPMIAAGQPIPNRTREGTQPVVDPRDVAEVAVTALTSAGHAGNVYTLTGPELLSLPDQVAIIGKEIGLSIETVDISAEVARQQMCAAGLDESVIEMATRGAEIIRGGETSILTADVEKVLGRAPRTFADWVRDHRAAFA